jgi:hypothetical protein
MTGQNRKRQVALPKLVTNVSCQTGIKGSFFCVYFSMHK